MKMDLAQNNDKDVSLAKEPRGKREKKRQREKGEGEEERQ